jgi:pimeloyl-ACP methyl ester carboxylesterase
MTTRLRQGQDAHSITAPGPRRPGAIELAAGAGGLALAVLVGRDGSPGWQVIRVLAVVAATSILLGALARSPARWRGRVAALAGIPAIAIAIGFAPHWAKGGPAAVRGAALLLGVAGLTLATGGTVVATRGRRWWRRVAAGLAVLVAVAMVTFVVGVAVMATNVPRPGIGATPASVGLGYTDVTLRTADGVDLAAWYVPSANGAAVVLLHGAGSTRSNVLDEAEVLAEAGFGVLLVDARGHGESDGRAMDFGWFGDADIAAATAHLAARRDVDPDRIGAVGLSMGGEEAIAAAASDARIAVVVAEGAGAIRTTADTGSLSGFGRYLAIPHYGLQTMVADLFTGASPPIALEEAMGRIAPRPVLLISAARELEYTERYLAAAPDSTELWAPSGAPHIGGLATHPAEYRERVASFLDGALGEA